jgi:2-haloacid dehalogenase
VEYAEKEMDPRKNLAKEDVFREGVEKAVVFDAYGTLFDLNTFALECEKLRPGKGSQILEIVEEKQLEYTWLRSLLGKFKDYASITRDAIKFALKVSEVPYGEDTIEELFSVFLSLKPFDDAERALNDLDEIESLRVVLFSNGTQAMLDKLVENAGLSLLSEEVVSAEGSERYKPDPKAYQHVLNHLELYEKGKALYISSSTWDVAGAESFGFEVAWVNRTGQPSFDDELIDFRPDYEFSSLGELVKMLTR